MNAFKQASLKNQALRDAIDQEVQFALSLSPGDWDDEDRTQANDWLAAAADTGQSQGQLCTSVIEHLISKYDLLDLRVDEWGRKRQRPNSPTP